MTESAGLAAHLYMPERHEALRPLAWDAETARATIEEIVRATRAACHRGSDVSAADGPSWPIHPQDDDGQTGRANPSLYYGATGVIWALKRLLALGYGPAAAVTYEAGAAAYDALEAWTQAWLGPPDGPPDGSGERSYLMGAVPILMLRYEEEPDARILERLATLLAANIHHPARELMWGAPGSLLAAWFLFRHTGEGRFADLVRRLATALESELLWSDARSCHYWSQDLYGRTSTYLDGVHGFIATAGALVRARDALGDEAWRNWEQKIERTVTATAERAGGCCNWPAFLDEPEQFRGFRLMQYCHGAPGFVVNIAALPLDGLDEILVEAGEATWRAGPLAKGSNLCHGTGGNGYAFLKLYQRTGDALWLERARAFAMHAIEQYRAAHAQHGMGRHSLWTGDPGLALFLSDCLDGSAEFPTIDRFFSGGGT